jgi:predicted O-linked N-acetylglucosamine transferase (SPINDLY family)
MVLRQSGRVVDAIILLKRALSLDAKSAEVCSLLAASLLDIGEKSAAREALVQATQLAPDNEVLHHNLGTFLKEEGELNAALTSLSRAVAISPTMRPALQNLALTNFALGNIETCLKDYERLLALPGVDAATHYAYGNALMTAGDASHALRQYQRAIDLEPENARAHWAIAMANWRPIYDDVEGIEEARMAFTNAIAALDTWFTPARLALGAAAVGSTQPFYLAYQAYDNRSTLRRYGDLCTRLMQPITVAAGARFVRPPPRARGKLRVGFASAHVHYHSVWNAITKGWITHLDPSRFEVYVFHLGLSADGETAHARREATEFVDKPRTLADWTQAILEAELDALVYPDIGMDSMTTQLAAQRLAPVQAAGWGHPDTTGLRMIDLFLSAELFEPASGPLHYTERLVRLPNLGVFVERLTPVVVAPDLAHLGLPDGEALLLCPGQLFKYSPDHDDVWVKLGSHLQSRGQGRLVFFRSIRAEVTRQFEQRLRRAFANSCVDFDRTVCIVPNLSREQFFGLMQRAALMLDTIGFSGFNTALQGLECGLPIVAYEGEFMRGRLASGLLRRLGLDDWVAGLLDDFVCKAMRLVEDPQLRLSLSKEITARNSILFNDLAPVRALEQVLVDAVALGARMDSRHV